MLQQGNRERAVRISIFCHGTGFRSKCDERVRRDWFDLCKPSSDRATCDTSLHLLHKWAVAASIEDNQLELPSSLECPKNTIQGNSLVLDIEVAQQFCVRWD